MEFFSLEIHSKFTRNSLQLCTNFVTTQKIQNLKSNIIKMRHLRHLRHFSIFFVLNWRNWRKWRITSMIILKIFIVQTDANDANDTPYILCINIFFVFPFYSIYFIKFFSHTIIYASFASFASFQYKKYTKIRVKMVFFWNSLIKKYYFLVQVEVFLRFSAKILVNLHCLNGKCDGSNIFWKKWKKYLGFGFF